MGLIGKFSDLPECKTFYFRVRTPKGYTFDTASVQHENIHDAYDSMKKVYPGASIRAIIETEFDNDGLPVLRQKIRKERAHETRQV